MAPKKVPFFSVVIPTLNEERYLPKLLRDLSRQTFRAYEVLVVDGGSSDKTRQVAQRFKKVRVLTSPYANVGRQRNLGGRNAQGRYILFMDADTRLPTYFLEGIKYRLSTTKADAFTTWMSQKDVAGPNKAVVAFMNFITQSSYFLENPSAFGAFIGCRRSVFEQSKGFDPEITFAEDTEFVKRLVSQGYRFRLFKDPRFKYSLRRFEKEGTLPMIRKYAKLDLEWLANGFPKQKQKDYPMIGGTYYQTGQKQYSQFFSRLDKVLAGLRRLRNKRTLQRFIENFFLD
jgi:glycosyltransferase involved in cell wall biosynthesis